MKIIRTRIFKILVVSLVVGVVLGIISFIIIDKKELNTDLLNYINLIKNGKYNYLNSLLISLLSNIKFSFFIWIFGILFIFSFISIFMVLFKGISYGFMLSSIIYTFKIKGVFYALILSITSVFNIIIFLMLSYYSINFSIKTFNAFRNNRQVNFKSFFINYIYIYLILLIFLVLSSLFEIYISSNIIKFVV